MSDETKSLGMEPVPTSESNAGVPVCPQEVIMSKPKYLCDRCMGENWTPRYGHPNMLGTCELCKWRGKIYKVRELKESANLIDQTVQPYPILSTPTPPSTTHSAKSVPEEWKISELRPDPAILDRCRYEVSHKDSACWFAWCQQKEDAEALVAAMSARHSPGWVKIEDREMNECCDNAFCPCKDKPVRHDAALSRRIITAAWNVVHDAENIECSCAYCDQPSDSHSDLCLAGKLKTELEKLDKPLPAETKK